jgi:5-formyltetrahydrofolate cyclo-ligase
LSGPAEGDAAGAPGSKAELRARLQAWRAGLSPSEASRRSRLIEGHVLAWPLWREAGTVLLYLATPREVQTDGLVRAALAAGRRVAAPGLDGVLRGLSDPPAVRPSARRVPEPDPDRCPPVDPAVIELALVPGVAFDRRGRRLGRGAGFYDRLLPRLACPACGLAFAEQVVREVPADPWDRPLDYLATEAGVWEAMA